MPTHKEQYPDIVMVLPKSELRLRKLPALPAGYRLRKYQPGDEAEWKRIQRVAVGHKDENLDKWWPGYLQRARGHRIFFIEHMPSGKLVSTTGAIHSTYGDMFPRGGELAWVATDPRHRKMGLAACLGINAVNTLIEEKVENIFLSTDDEFLQAIRLYHRLGFAPCKYVEGLEDRWKLLCDKTGIPFAPSEWMTPQEFVSSIK